MKDTSFTRPFPPDRMQAAAATPQRTTHGSCAWSLPSRNAALRQPQDGAAPPAALRSMEGRAISNPLIEAEDARLSGTLRSLARRVKGLNIMQTRPSDSLLRSDTPPASYFAEAPVAAFTPIQVAPRSEPQRQPSDFIRPRSVKNALNAAQQTQVA